MVWDIRPIFPFPICVFLWCHRSRFFVVNIRPHDRPHMWLLWLGFRRRCWLRFSRLWLRIWRWYWFWHCSRCIFDIESPGLPHVRILVSRFLIPDHMCNVELARIFHRFLDRQVLGLARFSIDYDIRISFRVDQCLSLREAVVE